MHEAGGLSRVGADDQFTNCRPPVLALTATHHRCGLAAWRPLRPVRLRMRMHIPNAPIQDLTRPTETAPISCQLEVDGIGSDSNRKLSGRRGVWGR